MEPTAHAAAHAASDSTGDRTAGPSTARRIIVLTVGAALFSCLFILSYGYAIHSPRPHHVRVDVVAGAATVTQVRASLEHAAPGGFDVRSGSSEPAARRAITDTDSYGALVVPASGPDVLLTAGAAGVQVQQLVSTALTHVAQAQGRPVEAVDLVPLPTADRAGQSAFVFELGLLIPGVVGGVGFYLVGRRARLWVRVAAAAGYAVLSSALAVVVLDLGLGALTGSPWRLLVTGALVAAAFALTVAALHALVGLPGTAIAVAALLLVGNPLNGSTVPVPLLPGGYREVAAWLPNGAAIRAFRDDTYFSGHGQAQPLLALALWAVGALVVIAATDVLHVRQRRLTPHRHEQIHSTPVLVHLRNRRAVARAAHQA